MAATTSLPTEQQRTDKPTLRDFRQEVTDNIVGMLERGVAPWQKPWEPGASSLGIPFNPTLIVEARERKERSCPETPHCRNMTAKTAKR